MELPVMPPVRPMLAKAVTTVPDPAAYADPVHPGLCFEPKWDGFRCLVFRDGEEVHLASRNTRELTRYFPEVVEAMRSSLPERCVLDGEVFVAVGSRLEFERLQDRIHPAESRVRMLAEQTPASFVAFDVLALDDESLLAEPFAVRRERLQRALAHLGDGDPSGTGGGQTTYLTRTTTDRATAREWFAAFEGAGLDGVVAKPLAAPYRPDARTMLKVKHQRTADVVLAGYRLHKTSTPEAPLLGSMLLGLYDDQQRLQHVGVSASFTAKRRAELLAELAPLEVAADEHPWSGWASAASHHETGERMPGAQSRWSAGKDLSFVPLRPERVLEVAYDHMEGTRFRHTAQFRRWRPDRDPGTCGYAQLEEARGYDLGKVLGGATRQEVGADG